MATYYTTTEELTSIANAIRTKSGTSTQLSYPTGFINSINTIPNVISGSKSFTQNQSNTITGLSNTPTRIVAWYTGTSSSSTGNNKVVYFIWNNSTATAYYIYNPSNKVGGLNSRTGSMSYSSGTATLNTDSSSYPFISGTWNYIVIN